MIWVAVVYVAIGAAVTRRGLLGGIAALAVAPALPRFGRPYATGGYVTRDQVRFALGLDVAGPDCAAVVSYKGNVYRAVHVVCNDWRG